MNEKAHIQILYGDDLEAIDAFVSETAEKSKKTGLSEMNLTLADGKGTSLADLANTVYAAPFLTDKRFVILKNALSLAGKKEENKKFLALLDSCPGTTELLLVIPDHYERKDWAALGKSNFLRKWAETGKAILTLKHLPSRGEMSHWILQKTTALGGQIEPSAAAALVSAIGNDTTLAANEIEKLLLYVDYQRPIDAGDVQELVTSVVSVSIFDMVDSLVTGNSKQALFTLHRLMEDQEIPILFSMIIRQFRLLLQTREILDEHGNSTIVQRELGQVPFIADKLCRQANAFSMDSLDTIYHQLLEIDLSFKTSQTDFAAALDLLILQIAKLINN